MTNTPLRPGLTKSFQNQMNPIGCMSPTVRLQNSETIKLNLVLVLISATKHPGLFSLFWDQIQENCLTCPDFHETSIVEKPHFNIFNHFRDVGEN